MLYLMFLKWMTVGFTIMAILSIPPFAINFASYGYDEISLADTTFGSQEDLFKPRSSSEDSYVDSAKDDVLDMYSGEAIVTIYFDIFYTAFFVIFLTVFKLRAKFAYIFLRKEK